MSHVLTPNEAADRYARWITKTGYSAGSQALYTGKVALFAAWLTDRWGEYAGALTDEHVRDWAVRDYREALLTVEKRAVATVESHLSAIASFYEYLGLGKPRVKRQTPPRGAPKGLDDRDLRKVMREAERRGAREHALAALLFLCAVRVGEAAALDTDDLFITDRQGLLHVRFGKGGESRQVPVPADARAALRLWLAQRRERAGDSPGPLFLSRTGGRLSKRQMQRLVGDMGEAVGVDLGPHMLRHTFAQKFLASGGDLGQLQEILGHRNLSSTQVYLRPNRDQLAAAAERVRINL